MKKKSRPGAIKRSQSIAKMNASNDRQKPYLAHVKRNSSDSWEIHDLEDHLRSVAVLAGEFAAPFGNTDWAYLAGLWHDLGKYSKEFQQYIRTASGFDATAHLETRAGRVDHSTAGAIHSIKQMPIGGRALSYLIAGHHAGLGDWLNADVGRRQLSQRMLQTELWERISTRAPTSILKQPQPTSRPPKHASPALWIRMLFSCLVDADFLDTEFFMDPKRSSERSSHPTLAELSWKLDAHLEMLSREAKSTPVNEIRANILAQCIEAARYPTGLFSLTVPTGGGKTLSSMAFAMKHALKYNKRRIIYVIPYTSIIEQTSNIFRSIFGDCVLEHHSNFDPEEETVASRLAAENWDAPIIVTTNVQFFESLFAARTSRTRKLHRLVNSVAVLDEAQLIPTEFLQPIRMALNELSQAFGMTILFSTATQPALGYETNRFKGLSNIKEVVTNVDSLYQSLQRVHIVLPEDVNSPTQPEALAASLSKHLRVLCILNRRDECRELFNCMPTDTIHLSGFMCGKHRSDVIEEIKNRLKQEVPVRVISTQLVEAGVDLDFPLVYRAISGLDSVAQAAGRCNREGLLKQGTVNLFISWRPTPRGHLRHMESAAREILRQSPSDIIAPAVTKDYFNHLYWIKGTDLDRHGIELDLNAHDDLSIRFRSAADKFKIIDDKHQQSIFVRFGDGSNWIEQLGKDGPSRWILRKLQRFSVSIPRDLFQKLYRSGDIIEAHPGYFAQASDGLYHPQLGFLGEQANLVDPDYLIV